MTLGGPTQAPGPVQNEKVLKLSSKENGKIKYSKIKKEKKTKNQQQKGNIWQIKIQNLLSDHVTVGCGIVGFLKSDISVENRPRWWKAPCANWVIWEAALTMCPVLS